MNGDPIKKKKKKTAEQINAKHDSLGSVYGAKTYDALMRADSNAFNRYGDSVMVNEQRRHNALNPGGSNPSPSRWHGNTSRVLTPKYDWSQAPARSKNAMSFESEMKAKHRKEMRNKVYRSFPFGPLKW